MRLYVLVEGQTEEAFIKRVLEPHLRQFQVWTVPFIVQTSRTADGQKRRGGGHWRHWAKDLKRLSAEHPGGDVRFTTLFDLYGLPDDFPEISLHVSPNSTQRAHDLETAMANVIGDWRLIPYLQRHEFEALVLAGLSKLSLLLDPSDQPGLNQLVAEIGATPPEEVNDGATTAPSKRLLRHLPSYRKPVHGPLVVEATGLDQLRARCPRFHAWVARLEALAPKQPDARSLSDLDSRPRRP